MLRSRSSRRSFDPNTVTSAHWRWTHQLAVRWEVLASAARGPQWYRGCSAWLRWPETRCAVPMRREGKRRPRNGKRNRGTVPLCILRLRKPSPTRGICEYGAYQLRTSERSVGLVQAAFGFYNQTDGFGVVLPLQLENELATSSPRTDYGPRYSGAPSRQAVERCGAAQGK